MTDTVTQSFLPCYDPETKRILGLIQLPYAHTFDGTETTFCIDYPNTPSVSNTVNVMKVQPYAGKSNSSRVNVNDWYMAAYFSHDQIYNNQHSQFARFQSIAQVAPSVAWESSAAQPNLRIASNGTIIDGLSRSFAGVATNDLTPINTAVPTISGTLTSGSTLTAANGTWTSQTAPTYTYQWLLNGAAVGGATGSTFVVPAGSSGKTVAVQVTATNAGYSAMAQSANSTITA